MTQFLFLLNSPSSVSYTHLEVKDDEFCVNLIPETLHRTIIGKRQIGDLVNIEIDPQTQARCV